MSTAASVSWKGAWHSHILVCAGFCPHLISYSKDVELWHGHSCQYIWTTGHVGLVPCIRLLQMSCSWNSSFRPKTIYLSLHLQTWSERVRKLLPPIKALELWPCKAWLVVGPSKGGLFVDEICALLILVLWEPVRVWVRLQLVCSF
jgi:hypothetical protein